MLNAGSLESKAICNCQTSETAMADIAAMAAVVLPCSSFLTPPKTVVMVLNMLLPAFPRLPLAVQSGSLGGDALKRFEKSQAGPPRKLRDCIGLLGSRGVNMSQVTKLVTGHKACKVVQSEVCHASSIVMPLTRGSRDFGKASPNPHRGHHQWERPWIE